MQAVMGGMAAQEVMKVKILWFSLYICQLYGDYLFKKFLVECWLKFRVQRTFAE